MVLEEIVAPAVCPETVAEIYVASLMAANPSKSAQKDFLAMLAARLKIEPGLGMPTSPRPMPLADCAKLGYEGCGLRESSPSLPLWWFFCLRPFTL